MTNPEEWPEIPEFLRRTDEPPRRLRAPAVTDLAMPDSKAMKVRDQVYVETDTIGKLEAALGWPRAQLEAVLKHGLKAGFLELKGRRYAALFPEDVRRS